MWYVIDLKFNAANSNFLSWIKDFNALETSSSLKFRGFEKNQDPLTNLWWCACSSSMCGIVSRIDVGGVLYGTTFQIPYMLPVAVWISVHSWVLQNTCMVCLMKSEFHWDRKEVAQMLVDIFLLPHLQLHNNIYFAIHNTYIITKFIVYKSWRGKIIWPLKFSPSVSFECEVVNFFWKIDHSTNRKQQWVSPRNEASCYFLGYAHFFAKGRDCLILPYQ